MAHSQQTPGPAEGALERILLVHCAYLQAGGEDSVVADETALLRRKGHEVFELRRNNTEIEAIGRVSLAAQTLWSRKTYTDTIELLERHRPDVVHVHNTFPLISPSLYWACAKAGVPVVQTLHNFRLACPQAMFLRDGKICEDCLGNAPWPAVRHKCFRGSRSQTSVIVGMLELHRGLRTFESKVARYIALNAFCKAKFIEAGLPQDRIVIKPNFVEDDSLAAAAERHGMLFVGRLSPEKGTAALASAWRSCEDMRLRVAGVGIDMPLLQSLPGVAMLGSLTPSIVKNEMRSARALVLPSIWYENFPRTLVEAFSVGLPVIASRIGALAELIEDGVTGLLVRPDDAEDLGRAMRWAHAHPGEMASMGANARSTFESLYTPDINYAQMVAIYRSAIQERSACRSFSESRIEQSKHSSVRGTN